MPYSVFFQHQVPLPLQAVCCQTRHISFLIFKQWLPRVTRQNCSGVTSFRFLVLSAALPQCLKPSLHQSCPCDCSEVCLLVFLSLLQLNLPSLLDFVHTGPSFCQLSLGIFPTAQSAPGFFIGMETSMNSTLPSLSVAVSANWHSQTTSGPQMLFLVQPAELKELINLQQLKIGDAHIILAAQLLIKSSVSQSYQKCENKKLEQRRRVLSVGTHGLEFTSLRRFLRFSDAVYQHTNSDSSHRAISQCQHP